MVEKCLVAGLYFIVINKIKPIEDVQNSVQKKSWSQRLFMFTGRTQIFPNTFPQVEYQWHIYLLLMYHTLFYCLFQKYVTHTYLLHWSLVNGTTGSNRANWRVL